jgi:hypothetical protein
MTRRLCLAEPIRFLKFALVGGMVQLGALASLAAIKVNYLIATGWLLKPRSCTILSGTGGLPGPSGHAPAAKSPPTQSERLFRFQLSNGSISLLGNLWLMRTLIGVAGPVEARQPGEHRDLLLRELPGQRSMGVFGG